MAIQTLAGVSGHLARLFDLMTRSQVNRSSRFFAWLPKKSYAGKAADWRVRGTGRVAVNFASGGAAPGGTADSRLEPTLAWARVQTEIEVAFDALIIALRSPNENAVLDLFEEEVLSAGTVIGKKLNAEMISGDGTSDSAVGIETGIAGSGAYAGVTDGSWVSASVDLAGGSLLPQTSLNDLDEAIFNKFGQPLSGERGDIYLTTPALFKSYQNDIGSAPREIINQPATGKLAVGQTSGLEFNGVPLFRDVDSTTGKVYGVRRDNIQLKFLPVTQVNGMPLQNDRELVTGTLGFDEPTEMMIHFNELGRVGNAIKWQVWVQYQLCVIDRFAHGVLDVIT